jgi:hypothetical protein
MLKPPRQYADFQPAGVILAALQAILCYYNQKLCYFSKNFKNIYPRIIRRSRIPS